MENWETTIGFASGKCWRDGLRVSILLGKDLLRVGLVPHIKKSRSSQRQAFLRVGEFHGEYCTVLGSFGVMREMGKGWIVWWMKCGEGLKLRLRLSMPLQPHVTDPANSRTLKTWFFHQFIHLASHCLRLAHHHKKNSQRSSRAPHPPHPSTLLLAVVLKDLQLWYIYY